MAFIKKNSNFEKGSSQYGYSLFWFISLVKKKSPFGISKRMSFITIYLFVQTFHTHHLKIVTPNDLCFFLRDCWILTWFHWLNFVGKKMQRARVICGNISFPLQRIFNKVVFFDSVSISQYGNFVEMILNFYLDFMRFNDQIGIEAIKLREKCKLTSKKTRLWYSPTWCNQERRCSSQLLWNEDGICFKRQRTFSYHNIAPLMHLPGEHGYNFYRVSRDSGKTKPVFKTKERTSWCVRNCLSADCRSIYINISNVSDHKAVDKELL